MIFQIGEQIKLLLVMAGGSFNDENV